MLIIKKRETRIIGMENPIISRGGRMLLFIELKFEINQKTKNAEKSKIATTLKRKAIPRRSPAENNFRFRIRRAAAMIGKSMKFSALAIFPSRIGRAKIRAKTDVIR